MIAGHRAASRTFSRAPGPPARRRVSSSDHHRGRAYKYAEFTVAVLLLCFCHRRRLAPSLAAAAVEPPPATQITPASSTRPRASVGPPELAQFRLNHRNHLFLLQLRSEHRHHRPHVARPLQLVAVITKSTTVTAVSP
jgi:hypothetical protein